MITLTVIVAAIFTGMLLSKAWNRAAMAVARRTDDVALQQAA